MRTIVHVDMDAFFCAVETRFHPEYAGRCLIVGGHKNTPRAVVSSCSYEARKFGVHSAMPIVQAARLCPHGIFVPPNGALYRQVSEQVHAVFREFSPVVEPVSIDEAFIDMTGCEHFYSSIESMGRVMQERVFQATKCTASVGIAPCKFLAKLASDMRKPRGLLVIKADDIDSVLLPLHVGKLWGVGEKTAEALARLGIITVADLRLKTKSWLHERFGKGGIVLYELARGIDNRPVEPPGPAKSIGHEVTFTNDIPPGPLLEKELHQIARSVAKRLQQDGRYGRTVVLKLRFSDFTTITRRHTLSEGLHTAQEIGKAANALLVAENLNRPIRLLGIYIADLSEHQQLGLFADPRRQVVEQLLRKLNQNTPNSQLTTAADLTDANAQTKKEEL